MQRERNTVHILKMHLLFRHQLQITSQNTSQNRAANAEIKLAGFLTEHNIAFNVTDHLIDLCKDIFSDSKIAQSIS